VELSLEPDERVPRPGVHAGTGARGMVRAGGWHSGVATGTRRFHRRDPEPHEVFFMCPSVALDSQKSNFVRRAAKS
jgi:hypothetical protein